MASCSRPVSFRQSVLELVVVYASATVILGVTDDSDGSDPVGELQAQAIGTGQDGTTFVVEALPTDPTEDTLTGMRVLYSLYMNN